MPPRQESEKLIEPALERTEPRVRPAVPLPNGLAIIPRGPQQLRDHPLAHRHPVRYRRVHRRVVPAAEPVLVSPGDQPRPARPAHRPRHIRLGEPNPLRRDPIDRRRRDVRAPVEPDIRVPKVVRDNQNKVRLHALLLFAAVLSRVRTNRPARRDQPHRREHPPVPHPLIRHHQPPRVLSRSVDCYSASS